jgi:transcriptional regulator with XRE-family HTH domain
LTPERIRGLRQLHDRNRKEFAADTGIGEASLGRWESGAVIQSAQADAYLRLLESRWNYFQVRAHLRNEGEATADPRPANRQRRVARSAAPGFDLERARAHGKSFSLCRRKA